MKRRILSLLLSAAVCLGLLTVPAGAASTVASGTCGDQLTWTLDSAGLLSISGTGAMDSYSHTAAPWDTYKTSILSVAVAPGVTTIGSCAFEGCSAITEVSLPDTLTTIGYNSFADCDALLSITFPTSLEGISVQAFYSCDYLRSVIIPASVTYIGDLAFAYCSRLTDVYYSGTEEQWTEAINSFNIRSAFTGEYTAHCNCCTVHTFSDYYPDYGGIQTAACSVCGATHSIPGNYDGYTFTTWYTGYGDTVGASFSLFYSTHYMESLNTSGRTFTFELVGDNQYRLRSYHYRYTKYDIYLTAVSGTSNASFDSEYGPYYLIGTKNASSATLWTLKNNMFYTTLNGVEYVLRWVRYPAVDDTNFRLSTAASNYSFLLSGMNITPPHTHTPAEAVRENEVAATCKDAGSYDSVVYCSGCSEELSRESVTIDKISSHTPAEPVQENLVPATCKDEGSYDSVVYCTICSEELSRESGTIAKTDIHSPAEAVRENEVPASCKDVGSYDSVVYCSVCSGELSRESVTIAKTDTHSPAEAVRENEAPASYAEAGSFDSVVYCSVCSGELSRVTISLPALGPQLVEQVDVSYDPQSGIVFLKNVPTGLHVVLAVYEADGRMLWAGLRSDSNSMVSFLIPSDLSPARMSLFFLTDAWQPISQPRTVTNGSPLN